MSKDNQLFDDGKPSETEAQVPAVQSGDRLLEKVLASGNIEVLKRYIALRKSEEEWMFYTGLWKWVFEHREAVVEGHPRPRGSI